MLSKSSTEFMSILYQFFKIGYGIGLVIICVAVICYAYRIISLNKKVKKDKKGKKAFRENKMQAKENLKLWVLGGGLVVIATFCARSIIPLGEEIVTWRIEHEFIIFYCYHLFHVFHHHIPHCCSSAQEQ